MPKDKKTLLSFWEDQMKQSHTSSNYFFRKSPSHYHMMLLVMSAYKEQTKLSVEELKTRLFKTSRPKSALIITEACEKGFFRLEKTDCSTPYPLLFGHLDFAVKAICTQKIRCMFHDHEALEPCNTITRINHLATSSAAHLRPGRNRIVETLVVVATRHARALGQWSIPCLAAARRGRSLFWRRGCASRLLCWLRSGSSHHRRF